VIEMKVGDRGRGLRPLRSTCWISCPGVGGGPVHGRLRRGPLPPAARGWLRWTGTGSPPCPRWPIPASGPAWPAPPPPTTPSARRRAGAATTAACRSSALARPGWPRPGQLDHPGRDRCGSAHRARTPRCRPLPRRPPSAGGCGSWSCSASRTAAAAASPTRCTATPETSWIPEPPGSTYLALDGRQFALRSKASSRSRRELGQTL